MILLLSLSLFLSLSPSLLLSSVLSRSVLSFVHDSRCVFVAEEAHRDDEYRAGDNECQRRRETKDPLLLEMVRLLRFAPYSARAFRSLTVSCHELRCRRILPLAMNIFLLLSPLSHGRSLFLSLSSSHSLLLFSRGHSVSTRGTPLRAREWRLSRLARPFQRAGAIPSFLPASLLAYLPVCPPSSVSPSLIHPFHPLSCTYSNFARSPQADNCRRACARCHPDCLIVS